MTNYSIRVQLQNVHGETRLFEFVDFEDMISGLAPLVAVGGTVKNVVRVNQDNYTINIGEEK